MIAHIVDGTSPTLQWTKAEHMPATDFPGATVRKFGEFVQLLKARLLHVIALGAAIAGSELLNTYPVIMEVEDVPVKMWIAVVLLNRLLDLLIVVVVCTAIQVSITQRRQRVLALTIATIAAGLATSAFQSSETWMRTMEVSIKLGTPGLPMFLYILWLTVIFSSLLVILYEWQVRADHVMEAVRDTLIADEAIERQTLESRLSGMKARVDPEFLFAVIARTEVLYREDIDAAERLLEQLIDFLRATLPRSSDATSTLEQEVALCGSFLVIEKALRREELSYQTKVDAGVASSYFPPSVLLPLLQTLLAPRGQTTRPIHLSITSAQKDSRVRTELTAHAVLAPPSQELLLRASVALRTFFGEYVTVAAKSAAFTGTTICIEVPYVET